jgi:hypothetical protein
MTGKDLTAPICKEIIIPIRHCLQNGLDVIGELAYRKGDY